MTAKVVANELRRKGFKLTPQRKAIIKIISESEQRQTPADIFEELKGRNSDVSLVTVYRTLELLEQNGMLCEINVGASCRSYLRRARGHHHHIVCSSCGKAVDFKGCQLEELEQRINRETGFKIDRHLLEFIGRCRPCQEKGARGKPDDI